MSHSDTIIILNNYVNIAGWNDNTTIGPTNLWNDALEWDYVIEMGRKISGKGKGFVYGKYRL